MRLHSKLTFLFNISNAPTEQTTENLHIILAWVMFVFLKFSYTTRIELRREFNFRKESKRMNFRNQFSAILTFTNIHIPFRRTKTFLGGLSSLKSTKFRRFFLVKTMSGSLKLTKVTLNSARKVAQRQYSLHSQQL